MDSAYEWIVDNEDVIPVLSDTIGQIVTANKNINFASQDSEDLDSQKSKTQNEADSISVGLVALGVGTSRIEVVKDHFNSVDSLDCSNFSNSTVDSDNSTNSNPISRYKVQILGLDIDEQAMRESKERRPDIDFQVVDLGEDLKKSLFFYNSVEKPRSSRNGNWFDPTTRKKSVIDMFDENREIMFCKELSVCPNIAEKNLNPLIVFDKGTLDYLICQEVGKFCAFMRNVVVLMHSCDTYVDDGETESEKSEAINDSQKENSKTIIPHISGAARYALISFRDRDLLVELLNVYGLTLESEHKFGEERQAGVCYIFRYDCIDTVNKGEENTTRILLSDYESQEKCVQKIMDSHFQEAKQDLYGREDQDYAAFEKRIRELVENEGDIFTDENEIFTGSRTTSLVLENYIPLSLAYQAAIPAALKGEYSEEYFLQDLRDTQPAVVERGVISANEIMVYLNDNM